MRNSYNMSFCTFTAIGLIWFPLSEYTPTCLSVVDSLICREIRVRCVAVLVKMLYQSIKNEQKNLLEFFLSNASFAMFHVLSLSSLGLISYFHTFVFQPKRHASAKLQAVTKASLRLLDNKQS